MKRMFLAGALALAALCVMPAVSAAERDSVSMHADPLSFSTMPVLAFEPIALAMPSADLASHDLTESYTIGMQTGLNTRMQGAAGYPLMCLKDRDPAKRTSIRMADSRLVRPSRTSFS